MKLVQMAMGLGLAVAAIGVGANLSKARKADAATLYHLSPVQAGFAGSCAQMLVEARLKLKAGASVENACACLATELASHGHDANDVRFYDIADRTMTTLVRVRKSDGRQQSDEEAEASVQKQAGIQGVSFEELSSSIPEVVSSLGKCASPASATHQKAANQSGEQTGRGKSRCERMTPAQKAEAAATMAKHGATFDPETCLGTVNH